MTLPEHMTVACVIAIAALLVLLSMSPGFVIASFMCRLAETAYGP